jgi:DNA-binding winged helix-turn-helix (wHTH) protein
VALVENSGHVIGKNELMKQVWPDTFVEEANLSRHIFALRKALEDDKNVGRYIETIPRRGYRFVGGVALAQEDLGGVLVEEHSRSRIVIEEETQDDDAPPDIRAEAVQSDLNRQNQPRLMTASLASQTGRSTMRPAIVALLVLGLLAVGVGAYFFGRRLGITGWVQESKEIYL